MTFGEWLADEVPRRISSPSSSVRTARSGSFGVACRPADIRTRYSSLFAVDNLPWHGFGKICGDERDIDDGKYGMDEGPMRTFDKHVAWRYDDMCGSKYLPTVASLLADKVIREDEIVGTALKQSTRKVTPPAV